MLQVFPLDLYFNKRESAIAAFLIPTKMGGILVESGPGSTIGKLTSSLQSFALEPGDISDVFLTHIHLDHAGAAGWLARNGANIHVHPVGAPHLADPEKLLNSARRIYGQRMDSLWGEFLPVAAEKIVPAQDGEKIIIGDFELTAIYTPGHAEHHISWFLEEYCFSGDIAGIRLPGFDYIRLPLVPPELNFQKWIHSLEVLQGMKIKYIAPTHFGIFNDPKKHLAHALTEIKESEKWMNGFISGTESIEELRSRYEHFLRIRGRKNRLSDQELATYDISNPSWMGADGIFRLWKKLNDQ